VHPPSITAAIAEAVRSIDQPADFEALLRDVSGAARISVPDFDHASVTLLQPDGRFTTHAPTSELALQLDAAQYAAGEGPCLETARTGRTVSVPHLELDRRWPAYTARAAARGVQSHLSVVLLIGDGNTRGSLNLYSTTTDQAGSESVAMAELIGSTALATPAVGPTTSTPGPASEVIEVIGRALGIPTHGRDRDANSAFDQLVRDADRAGLSLPDHARRVVDQHHE
jgi:hypothetical protein